MARVNWEDDIYPDKRWQWLLIHSGNPTIAKGALLEAFVLAQKYFDNEITEGLIPFDEWEQQDMHPALLESKCAVKMEKGIYVMGSKTHFTWLKKKSEAGCSTSDKKIDALTENRKKRWIGKRKKAENDQNTTEHNRTDQNTTEPLPPSLSPNTRERERESSDCSDVEVVDGKLILIKRPDHATPEQVSEILGGVITGLAREGPDEDPEATG
jgi:hypothetical protein